MRFSLGPPPDSLSADELASGEWRRLRQLPLWAMQVMALPVGVAVAVLLFVAWVVLTPNVELNFDDSMLGMWVGLATLWGGVLLQIAAYRPAGFFRHAFVGFWPSRLTVYIGSTEKLSRERHLLVQTLPFLLLALGPLAFVVSTRIQSGWLIYVSCIAALGFGFNGIMAIVTAWQVPAGAQVAGLGFQAYWRVPAR